MGTFVKVAAAESVPADSRGSKIFALPPVQAEIPPDRPASPPDPEIGITCDEAHANMRPGGSGFATNGRKACLVTPKGPQ